MAKRSKKPKPHGPGRPRLGKGETVVLFVRITAEMHAELEREAVRRDVAIAEVVRERIAR